MIKSNYVKFTQQLPWKSHIWTYAYISAKRYHCKTSGINFVFTNELEKTQISVVDLSELSLSPTCIVHIQTILLCMFHVDFVLCPGLDSLSRKWMSAGTKPSLLNYHEVLASFWCIWQNAGCLLFYSLFSHWNSNLLFNKLKI